MSFKYLSIGKVLKIQEKIYELEKILSLTDNAVCGTAPSYTWSDKLNWKKTYNLTTVSFESSATLLRVDC